MTPTERRAAHRRAGRCRCGRPRDRADRVQCAGCRLSAVEYEARQRARVPDGVCRCGGALDREDRKTCARCCALSRKSQARSRAGERPDPLVRVSEIRKAWLEAPNVSAFAAWLREVSK